LRHRAGRQLPVAGAAEGEPLAAAPLRERQGGALSIHLPTGRLVFDRAAIVLEAGEGALLAGMGGSAGGGEAPDRRPGAGGGSVADGGVADRGVAGREEGALLGQAAAG